MRTLMPIMHGDMLKAIPWEVIQGHETQAQSNHGQSLERLAQRGGLSPTEALHVIEGRRWKGIDEPQAETALMTYISKF